MDTSKITAASYTFILFLWNFTEGDNSQTCHNLLRHPPTTNDSLEIFTDKLLCKANGKIRPNAHIIDDVTIVRIQLYINGFFDLSESNMQINLDVYFRQSWLDPRLAYDANATSGLKVPITLRPHHMHDIWLPDAVFVDERKGSRHDITVPNIYIRLYPNGTLNYSQRLTLTLSCPMDLHNFPMDKQDCPLRIESYNYYEDELVFLFDANRPVTFRENTSIPEYFVGQTADLRNCSSHYATGDFSCIEAIFHLRRDFGYYFIQVYIPCFLIVGLSWISFMLDVHATPARVSLGLLTVLTMTTQSTGSRAQLPRVSYVNALDVWLATCLLFVFAALLEYSVANVLARWEDQALKSAYIKEESKLSSATTVGLAGTRDNPKDMEDTILKLFKVMEVNEGQPTWDKTYKMRTSFKIEYASRFIFPAAFLVFNIFYWAYYVEAG